MGDSKPAYMAIASAPAAKGSEIELLIKNQGPTAELLCSVKEGATACALARPVFVSKLLSLVLANTYQRALPRSSLTSSSGAGDAVDVSPVIGSGFPVDRAPAEKYPTLVVFATGTGIAPIKALIESSALDVSPQCMFSTQIICSYSTCKDWVRRQHSHQCTVHVWPDSLLG